MANFTVLGQDGQALLNEQVVVQDNKSERQRQNIVTGPDLEKLANLSLRSRLDGYQSRTVEVGLRGNGGLVPRIARTARARGTTVGGREQGRRERRARGVSREVLTSPCIWSLSRGPAGLGSDIVRLLGLGRRYDEGATKGSS